METINRITLQKILNSKKLNLTDLRSKGISSSTLAKIGRGEEIRTSTVTKIANALGVEAALLVETNPMYIAQLQRLGTAGR